MSGVAPAVAYLIPGMAPTPFTILVVDECPSVRLFVDLAVGSDAVSVVGAADGHAALAYVDRARPDLVLAATGLTGLSGYDLAVRLSCRGVPVVLITGSLSHLAAEEGTAAEGVLTKPLQADQLRALVADMVVGRLDVEEPDVIDAWLSDADSSLGLVPEQKRRSLAIEAGDLHSFTRDVAALRDGRVTVHPLQFTHRGDAAL